MNDKQKNEVIYKSLLGIEELEGERRDIANLLRNRKDEMRTHMRNNREEYGNKVPEEEMASVNNLDLKIGKLEVSRKELTSGINTAKKFHKDVIKKEAAEIDAGQVFFAEPGKTKEYLKRLE